MPCHIRMMHHVLKEAAGMEITNLRKPVCITASTTEVWGYQKHYCPADYIICFRFRTDVGVQTLMFVLTDFDFTFCDYPCCF